MREFDEIAQRTEGRVHAVVVGNVVTIVLAGRRLEGHQPYRSNTEPMQIIEPTPQPLESPMPSPLASMYVPTERQYTIAFLYQRSLIIGQPNCLKRSPALSGKVRGRC